MPYIKKEYRNEIYEAVDFTDPTAFGDAAHNAGELNYIITSILLEYIYKKGELYSIYNEVIGVLECAKLELYRRHIASYEDEKIKENGDL